MASNFVKMYNPHTGGVGDVDVERLGQATKDGLMPAHPVQMFNPHTGGTGEVAPDMVHGALGDGLVPVGSRAHKVASTGTLESLGRGILQGGTLGFADEISGAIESLLSNKTYEQARDESRTNFGAAEEAHPIAYHGGEIGGGVASAFLPGGHLAKGASLAKEALFGAGMGGAAGLGYSEAKDAQGMMSDVKSGVVSGGLGTAALGGISNILGKTIPPATRYVRTAFDPEIQTALALGSSAREFKGRLGTKVANAVETIRNGSKGEEGDNFIVKPLFMKNPDGSFPDLEETISRAQAYKTSAADNNSKLLAGIGQDYHVDSRQIWEDFLQEKAVPILEKMPPTEQGSLQQIIYQNILKPIDETGGNLAKLWELKKNTGDWASKAWSAPGKVSYENEVYMEANKALEKVLEDATDSIAREHNLPQLARSNSIYSAMSTAENLLIAKRAKELAGTQGGPRLFRSTVGGMAGGAIGSAIGGPMGGILGAGAGALGQAAAYSTQGRLTRAQIGGYMQHVKQQASSIAAGMMPRTLVGARGWLQQHLPMLQPMIQQMPPLGNSIKNVLTMPPEKAEIEIRALLPMVQQFMAPSPFVTEFDGKVSDPHDVALATKMLDQAKLPIAQHTLRLSALNKDGTLPAEIWGGMSVDSGNQDQQADELAGFDQRVKGMGY
jgi:hypothetical protein